MYDCTLDTVYGPAVDQDKTTRCHQISCFSENNDTGIKTIHYSVSRPSGTLVHEKMFINNLQDILSDRSFSHKEARFYKAHTLFSKLMAGIKTDKKSHFIKDVPSPAVTFDINFDDSFKMQSIDFRLTNAIMTEEIKCDQARQNVKSDKPDKNLKMWHDFIMYYKYEEPIRRTLLFEDITATTTTIIHKYMCEYAVENKLGGIFKVPPELEKNGKYPKVYTSTYGSTLDFETCIQEIGCDKSKAVLPTTASREPIDAINLLSIVTYKKSGENIVSPDFLNALINYKTMKSNSRLAYA